MTDNQPQAYAASARTACCCPVQFSRENCTGQQHAVHKVCHEQQSAPTVEAGRRQDRAVFWMHPAAALTSPELCGAPEAVSSRCKVLTWSQERFGVGSLALHDVRLRHCCTRAGRNMLATQSCPQTQAARPSWHERRIPCTTSSCLLSAGRTRYCEAPSLAKPAQLAVALHCSVCRCYTLEGRINVVSPVCKADGTHVFILISTGSVDDELITGMCALSAPTPGGDTTLHAQLVTVLHSNCNVCQFRISVCDAVTPVNV